MNIVASITLWTTYLVSLYFSIFFILVFLDKRKFFNEQKPTLKSTPTVSIIVPAYNEEKGIIDTLRSIISIDYPKDKLDIIVVNDGSKDNTEVLVKQFITEYPYVKLLSHVNQGKAASLNRALEKATGEFFVCLDADSTVDPSALKNMIALYQKDPNDLAIITPVLKVKSPKNMLQRVQWLEYLVMSFISRLASHIDALYVAPGPFSLYKTSIIRNLGGFDEKCITEDQEIAYRVQLNQMKLKQCSTAIVHTTAPKTFKTFTRQRRRWYKGSIACLFRYRKMLLNKKYGDFGMIQLMKNVTGIFIAMSGMFFAGYFIVLPIIEKIQDLSLVRFDIIPYIKNIKFDPNLLGFDIPRMFIYVIFFAITCAFLYYSHKSTNEKLKKVNLIPLIPYLFVYYLLKGSIFIYSLIEYSVSAKDKW